LQNFLQKKKKKLNVIEKWSQSLKQIYRNNIHVCSQIYKLKIRGDSLAEWFSLVTPD
jgi:regulator of replication initiation timing